MKILAATFIGLILVVVHCQGDELQDLLAKSMLIVDRPILENIKQKSSAIKDHIVEIREEMTTPGSGKGNVEWIDALQKLFMKDDILISVLDHAVIINFEFDSIKKICQQHLGGKYLREFESLFDQIVQLTVPIDTFSLIVFEYFEQLLGSNKKFLENKKGQKLHLGEQSIGKTFRSIRDNLRNKLDTTKLKKIIDKYSSPTLKSIERVTQSIARLLRELIPFKNCIAEIRRVLIASKPGNEIERDKIVLGELIEAMDLLRNKEYLETLTNLAKTIYQHIENVNFSQGDIVTKIDSLLPYETKFGSSTFLNNWMRWQMIKTRLNTQATGLNNFIRDYEPIISTFQRGVPFWLQKFSKYLNSVAKIPELVERNLELITSKTLKRLQFLVNSDESTKKDDSGAIAAMKEYIENFPEIFVSLPYDNSDKSFYSHMYHTQLLMPLRRNISSSEFDISRYFRVEQMISEMNEVIKEIKKRFGTFGDSLINDHRLSVSISGQLDSLNEAFGTNQTEVQNNLNEIKRLISRRLSELKKAEPKIKKDRDSLNDWMEKMCIPKMDAAFGIIQYSLLEEPDAKLSDY